MIDLSAYKPFALFKEFSESELTAISERAVQREVIAGDWLFEEGAAATSIFFIKAGMIDILKKGADRGEEQQVTELGTNSIIGEMAFIDASQRAAGARARENTHLLELSFQDIRSVMEKHPMVGLKFYRNLAGILAKRIRQTTNNLSSIKEMKLKSL